MTNTKFSATFNSPRPVIGCIHLLPLPGSPLYSGDMTAIYDQAIQDALIYEKKGVHGLIIENFRDMPFYPDAVPAETVAAMAAISRQIACATHLPFGINVLRNDAVAAVSIAAATGAHFVRINIHMHAAVTDQGIIAGLSYASVRHRKYLNSNCLIFADFEVKHSAPLANFDRKTEILDLFERGLADALIISGSRTGTESDPELLGVIHSLISIPCLVGSGITPGNLKHYWAADGFIVGSCFKIEGSAMNLIDPLRVEAFMTEYNRLMDSGEPQDLRVGA